MTGMTSLSRILALVAAGCLMTACSSGSKTPKAARATPTATTSTSTNESGAASSAAATTSTSSQPAASTPASAAGAACSLATAADVAAAYGEQFDPGKASSPGGQSSCLFVQTGGGIDTVDLIVVPGSQADLFYTTNRSGYTSTDVGGIGDKAWVSSDGGAMGVEKSGTTILLHDVGFEKDAPAALQAKEEAFAKLVVSRLH
jgi:hypothetical protein